MIKAFRVAMATAITAAALVGVGSANANVKAEAFATGFQVVNLSDAEANITISFYAEGASTVDTTFTDTIPANGNKPYSDLSVSIPALTEGFGGGAVVSSDQEVAVIVNATPPGDFGSGAATSGVSAGATEVLIPLVFRNQASSAYDTFVNVQNTGTENANVTITFDNGTSQNSSVAPGSSARFDQATNADLPNDFVGSAIVSSDQPVAAAVIQNGNPAIMGYNGFTGTSTAPIFPLITSLVDGSGAPTFFTGLAIQNAGETDTEVTVTYTPSENDQGEVEGTTCTETRTIPARGSANFGAILTFELPADTAPDATTCNQGVFVGSAQVTTNSANQPLVGIANQLNNPDFKGGAYNAVDASEASDTVILALVQDRLFGYFTSSTIVNVGTSETTVNCVFAGTDVTLSRTLGAGETWAQPHVNLFGDSFSQSGVCTADSSDAQIIGVLNQLNASGASDSFFVSNLINN